LYPYGDCSQDTSYYKNPKTHLNEVALNLIPYPQNNIITIGIYEMGNPAPIGYLSSSSECVDCSIRGATKPPPFWK
jgi:hypothetical protein